MQQSKSNFTAFKLIHKGMLLGQIIATVIFLVLIVTKTQSPSFFEYDRFFQIVALLFTAASFFVGNILYKMKITSAKENIQITIQQKFERYRNASLLQWALLEAASLFNGIAYFLVGNYAFIALASVIILLFAMQAPNKTKMALQLGLPLHEVEDL